MPALAVLLAVLGAACGGGSSSVTRREYIHRADAVCREAAKQVLRVSAPKGSSESEIGRAAARIVAAQRRALAELKALPEPSEPSGTVTKWIALVDQTLDQADASVRAQQRGDVTTALRANQHGAVLDGRADELARGYGMRVCVSAAAASAPTPGT